jgi:hypothetical protein
MAGKPAWLRNVLGETVALLRSSDTVEWLTTEAAGRLTDRAAKRETAIAEMREKIIQHDHNRVDQFDAAVRFATAEAAMQKGLADWLKDHAPKKEGDV